ncbi:cystatin-A1-like [Plectropomus leopardus]|uniref:cystatin-A1-like n=1 Tax=Plectropomus leopardus TaxID=160734 RepID=UPI001C4B17A5|nr:cystatin-A1-like [Plectropomus leopardus]
MADDFGKWSETMNADEGTQDICDHVKSQVVKKTGQDFAQYKSVQYRQLLGIVGASHYLIKVHVGDVNYIHLYVIRIVYPNATPTLEGVQQNKTKDDPLEPFTN